MKHPYDTPSDVEEQIETIRDVIAANVNDARRYLRQAILSLHRASELGAQVDDETGQLENAMTDLAKHGDNLDD